MNIRRLERLMLFLAPVGFRELPLASAAAVFSGGRIRRPRVPTGYRPTRFGLRGGLGYFVFRVVP